MDVVYTISLKLLIDTSKTENEKECKVATILCNHLKIDINGDDEFSFCYVLKRDIAKDLIKQGIDKQFYSKCIKSFSQRGWLRDYEDGVLELLAENETREMDKTGGLFTEMMKGVFS